jgi:hypothetical protein
LDHNHGHNRYKSSSSLNGVGEHFEPGRSFKFGLVLGKLRVNLDIFFLPESRIDMVIMKTSENNFSFLVTTSHDNYR